MPDQKRSLASDIQKMHLSIVQLEEMIRRIERHQKESFQRTEDLLKDCNDLLAQVKSEFHQALQDSNELDYESLTDIPIEDRKLKKAWIDLFKYHNGATADIIAVDLKRHRTTVSTYLNTLVLMRFAKKERTGHEIIYKAVIPRNDGQNE